MSRRSFRCLPNSFENQLASERERLSFLQVLKDYCCPNYEAADALFNKPTYIARAGYE